MQDAEVRLHFFALFNHKLHLCRFVLRPSVSIHLYSMSFSHHAAQFPRKFLSTEKSHRNRNWKSYEIKSVDARINRLSY